MTPPKLLTCQGCGRGFATKDQLKKRCPVLLDCGHSVCEECVRAAAAKSPLMPCPLCQQITVVQDKTLPPDAFINGCLVLNVRPRLNEESLTFVTAKKTKQLVPEKTVKPTLSEKEKCEECGSNYGSLLCAKCEDTRFCTGCFQKVHRASKLLSRHVSRPAPPGSSVASGSDSGAALADARCCPLHAGRPLEYYCTDDEVAVCSHCSISGEHKGHTVEPLSDRNARRRPELEEAVQRAQGTLRRLRWAIKVSPGPALPPCTVTAALTRAGWAVTAALTLAAGRHQRRLTGRARGARRGASTQGRACG
ncbi:probable E3 ubiquitin-protein ligase MID2 [Amphibalanus amphitrite]|uniref:probable E3 ubiquitin-protein ligase MID2 n=1 Tax=Amphibalanus amphitrite TaxID=1232801 RepID=UPI001C90E29B|nr:probable E3 ubiquitin-protein ligase MID2 [Amphibalanus amphitrite]